MMRKATVAGLVCVYFTFVPVVSPSPALAGPNFQAVHDRIKQIVASKEEVGYLRAVEELERVLATWPEETDAVPWALFWVGTISHESGDVVRAIEAFQRLLEEFPRQMEAGAWARWGLANQCYLPRGEFDKGLPLLLEMVAHSNAYEGSNVPHCGALFLPWARLQLAEYLGKAASAYAEQGRPGEFAHLIRGALIGNWSGPAWETLADTMLALGQVARVRRSPEEREWYQTVVNNYEHFWLPGVPPPSADRDRALRWLACFQLIYGETRLAKQLCEQVLEARPGTVEAAQAGALLGRIQKARRDVRGSFTAYRAAVETLPANDPLRNALARVLGALGERGEWELAIQDVGPLIDAASANASAASWGDLYDALYTADRTLGWDREHVAAHTLLRASLELPFSVEKDTQLRVLLIARYMAAGDYEAAVAACQEMILKYPASEEAGWAQYRIGQCRSAQGRYREAREAYQKVKELYPGTWWAQAAQEEIDSLPDQGRGSEVPE